MRTVGCCRGVVCVSWLASFEGFKITLDVTYLEIYNDVAYDLLNASSGVNARLPKVRLAACCGVGAREMDYLHCLVGVLEGMLLPLGHAPARAQVTVSDVGRGCQVHNISVHPAPEDVALNLAFAGAV